MTVQAVCHAIRLGKLEAVRVGRTYHATPEAIEQWRNNHRGGAAVRKCSFEGCDEPHRSLGFCVRHYGQHKRGMELTPPPLKSPAPEKPAKPAPKSKSFSASPEAIERALARRVTA